MTDRELPFDTFIAHVFAFFLLLKGYRDKISDVREEIMRKRRAGKLPGNTTAVLKAWWNEHSKWPYPTVSHSADN